MKYQPSQVSCNWTARRRMRATLLTAFASTLSIKAAAWAAILYLSVHNCPAGFSNVKNVTAFNIWKENSSAQGISLSTTLICPGSVKPRLCNGVTISHIWNILTSTSGDNECTGNLCLSYDTLSASVRFFPWMTSLKTSPNFPGIPPKCSYFRVHQMEFSLCSFCILQCVCNQSLTQLSSPSS